MEKYTIRFFLLVATASVVAAAASPCYGNSCRKFCDYGCQPSPRYAETMDSADRRIARYIENQMAAAREKIEREMAAERAKTSQTLRDMELMRQAIIGDFCQYNDSDVRRAALEYNTEVQKKMKVRSVLSTVTMVVVGIAGLVMFARFTLRPYEEMFNKHNQNIRIFYDVVKRAAENDIPLGNGDLVHFHEFMRDFNACVPPPPRRSDSANDDDDGASGCSGGGCSGGGGYCGSS